MDHKGNIYLCRKEAWTGFLLFQTHTQQMQAGVVSNIEQIMFLDAVTYDDLKDEANKIRTRKNSVADILTGIKFESVYAALDAEIKKCHSDTSGRKDQIYYLVSFKKVLNKANYVAKKLAPPRADHTHNGEQPPQ